MLKIEKSYEENVQVAPFQFVKIGIHIKSDKELNNAAELEEASAKLLTLSKAIVRKELQQIKEEKKEQQDNGN